jgi:hypothetical protein
MFLAVIAMALHGHVHEHQRQHREHQRLDEAHEQFQSQERHGMKNGTMNVITNSSTPPAKILPKRRKVNERMRRFLNNSRKPTMNIM